MRARLPRPGTSGSGPSARSARVYRRQGGSTQDKKANRLAAKWESRQDEELLLLELEVRKLKDGTRLVFAEQGLGEDDHEERQDAEGEVETLDNGAGEHLSQSTR